MSDVTISLRVQKSRTATIANFLDETTHHSVESDDVIAISQMCRNAKALGPRRWTRAAG